MLINEYGGSSYAQGGHIDLTDWLTLDAGLNGTFDTKPDFSSL